MTHLRSIVAIARKEALDILLDKAKLGTLIFPLVLTLRWLLLSRILVAQPASMQVYSPTHSSLQQAISGTFGSVRVTRASSPDQVISAFGPNGMSKKASYDVGLIIPADIEKTLRAGGRPQVSLYVNGSAVSAQQSALLHAAVDYYARTVVAPSAPVMVTTATINPAPKASAALRFTSYYNNLALLLTFVVSLSLLPGLLIEEKKTLRMLMVSPASFGDVLLGKTLTVLVYQLALSLVVLALFGAFASNVPLLVLYAMLGIGLALFFGLLLGTLLSTASAAGGIESAMVFVFIIPAIFVPLAPYLGGNPIAQIIKIFPPYYVSEGIYNAMHTQGSFSSNTLDAGVTLGCIAVVFLFTVRALRRQAGVAATI
jgi:ABC-2 type transport system permease protein